MLIAEPSSRMRSPRLRVEKYGISTFTTFQPRSLSNFFLHFHFVGSYLFGGVCIYNYFFLRIVELRKSLEWEDDGLQTLHFVKFDFNKKFV